ncbi:FtsK/SpoIIIE domain-containing protein [Anaerobacillus sp. MEB173]|uniref:FtsK/SpoIIIE domain-containing protein n=1 Tax=Anaerobacillus sp. MEB173 TaxID=3383345 RepID=UPI003F8E8A1A
MIKGFLEKQKAKGKLLQAFRSGELYLTYKSGKNTHLILPIIHYVGIDKEAQLLTYVFSIPLGLDPKEVIKKRWLFEQQFGQNLEIEQENKRFTLKIFGKSYPKKLKWDFEKLTESFEGQIPIPCGIDRHGRIICIDLVENPHLLIAGFTGSGKSTQVRSILATLIQYFSPEELELWLIDMKMVEFQFYRNVKHVKEDIVVKGKDVKPLLQKIDDELERRQELMFNEGVTHITQLKEKQPFIIVAIDEVASLPNDKEIDEYLVEISNRGRALGVYLILSLLRPDSKNIDSRLKGNLTCTMGFKARDRINASVIGMKGAENLAGDGRFLMSIPDYDDLVELQAPYLSEKGLEKLLKDYKKTDEEIKKEVEQKQIDEVKGELSEKNIFGVLDNEKA